MPFSKPEQHQQPMEQQLNVREAVHKLEARIAARVSPLSTKETGSGSIVGVETHAALTVSDLRMVFERGLGASNTDEWAAMAASDQCRTATAAHKPHRFDVDDGVVTATSGRQGGLDATQDQDQEQQDLADKADDDQEDHDEEDGGSAQDDDPTAAKETSVDGEVGQCAPSSIHAAENEAAEVEAQPHSGAVLEAALDIEVTADAVTMAAIDREVKEALYMYRLSPYKLFTATECTAAKDFPAKHQPTKAELETKTQSPPATTWVWLYTIVAAIAFVPCTIFQASVRIGTMAAVWLMAAVGWLAPRMTWFGFEVGYLGTWLVWNLVVHVWRATRDENATARLIKMQGEPGMGKLERGGDSCDVEIGDRGEDSGTETESSTDGDAGSDSGTCTATDTAQTGSTQMDSMQPDADMDAVDEVGTDLGVTRLPQLSASAVAVDTPPTPTEWREPETDVQTQVVALSLPSDQHAAMGFSDLVDTVDRACSTLTLTLTGGGVSVTAEDVEVVAVTGASAMDAMAMVDMRAPVEVEIDAAVDVDVGVEPEVEASPSVNATPSVSANRRRGPPTVSVQRSIRVHHGISYDTDVASRFLKYEQSEAYLRKVAAAAATAKRCAVQDRKAWK